VGYYSKKLEGSQKNWGATKGEAYAVKYFVVKLRHFLKDKEFTA
jgi:hypothetical protein